jgi:hypothetical protein
MISMAYTSPPAKSSERDMQRYQWLTFTRPSGSLHSADSAKARKSWAVTAGDGSSRFLRHTRARTIRLFMEDPSPAVTGPVGPVRLRGEPQ